MKKEIYEKSKVVSILKCSTFFYFITSALFIMAFLVGRVVLLQKVVAARVSLQALSSDLFMAILILLLTNIFNRVHLIAGALFLLLCTVFHIANMEMAAALHTYIDISDLIYTTDRYFMKCSLSVMSFPWYTMSLFFVMILYIVALSSIKNGGPIRLFYMVMSIFIFVPVLILLTPEDDRWSSSNLLWLSIIRSIARSAHSADYNTGSRVIADSSKQLEVPLETGTRPYFRKPPNSRRNVLLVVIEGIPGVYLRQVQKWTGIKYPVEMANLSRIAEESLIVPNFIAHNRQTIRGLYSMLSGDYCKLSLTTPKIYEYLQLPGDLRFPCLPEILAKAGYTTAYLQAADLAFMSKNRFLPAAGFQRIVGKEYFNYQYVPFEWGPDDKAFFEQATKFIEDINRESNPWFITLLTVGTHHPYAVPEKLYREFPAPKLAAVAYLDEALGEFFNQLRQSGILDETLLIITSDESHGVTGQPFGNYWGLLVVRSPESFMCINPGVFGLVDIPISILDYLGLSGYPHFYHTRSVFREFPVDRTILFGPYFSEKKGIVKRRINKNCVKIFKSLNGELFSPEYMTKIVDGDEGKKQSEGIELYRMTAEYSLSRNDSRNRTYLILENDVFIIGKNENKLLSSGQYLDFPGGSSVTVELEATAEIEKESEGRRYEHCIKLVLQLIESYKKLPIPQISIPTLRDHDTLKLSFSFYTEESLTRFWAYLKAISVNKSYPTRLTVVRYLVKSEKCEKKHDFRINYLVIERERQKKGSNGLHPQCNLSDCGDNNSLSYQAGSMESAEYHKKNNLKDNFSMKYNDLQILSQMFNHVVGEITFSIGVLDNRYEYYMFIIRAKQKARNIRAFISRLNGQRVLCRWLDSSEGKIAIMKFPRSLLEENSDNTISFLVDRSTSYGNFSISSKLGSVDLEVERLFFQPYLPIVAHAGGSYKGLTYTNSLEALEKNSSYFQFFEIDFEWTSDNRLIGLHDWENCFHKIFGFRVPGPLEYDEICKLKPLYGITPLDLKILQKFFENNPSVRIITDVKSRNIQALKKIALSFPDFADRFIPQIYQPDEFAEVMNIGYKDVIWTLYRYPYLNEPDRILSHIQNWEDEYGRRLFAVTLPLESVKRGIAKVLTEAGIPIYTHTINSCDEYVDLIQLGVSSVYTDSIELAGCF